MGNRAVITTPYNFENNGVGIYLHWNGGRDSIEPFLAYCNAQGYRSPSDDESYGFASLTQTIKNFVGSISCGVNTVDHLDCDNYDNGVYLIEDWNIVGRVYDHGEQNAYDFYEMLKSINEAQPERIQLTDAEIEAIPLPSFYLNGAGDEVVDEDAAVVEEEWTQITLYDALKES